MYMKGDSIKWSLALYACKKDNYFKLDFSISFETWLMDIKRIKSLHTQMFCYYLIVISFKNRREWEKFLLELNWAKIYPSVYSLLYAPIENFFCLIKSYLKKNYKTENKKINLKVKLLHYLRSLKINLLNNCQKITYELDWEN